MCLLRDRRHQDIYRLWSKDNGRTWSQRERLREMLDCVLQGPVLTRLDAKTILLSGRDAKRRLVVVYLSRDNGHSFGERHVLDGYQRHGAYTTALVTGQGRVLMAWYSEQGTVALKPDIKLATLTVLQRPRWLWIRLPAKVATGKRLHVYFGNENATATEGRTLALLRPAKWTAAKLGVIQTRGRNGC